jgi:hypothetical protein
MVRAKRDGFMCRLMTKSAFSSSDIFRFRYGQGIGFCRLAVIHSSLVHSGMATGTLKIVPRFDHGVDVVSVG